MYRYTTPTLIFSLPISTENLDQAIVTVHQTSASIEKNIEDMTFEGNVLKVKLTQEETASLKPFSMCMVQLRVRCKDGNAFVSEQFRVNVLDVLKEGVI